MKNISKSFGIYIIIFALIMGMVYFLKQSPNQEVANISYSKIAEYFADNEVKSVKFEDVKIVATLKNDKKVEAYIQSPLDVERIYDKYINKELGNKNGIIVENTAPAKEPWYLSLLSTGVMILLFVFFWIFLMRQQGGGKVMNFGKSRARMESVNSNNKLTFKDVAGLEEEKQELEEIVDFLKYPRKYQTLGARIPKGILLVGYPGTGKTYISRATAGEAGVPFFTISGSDFVEMFVGVGASRVRDLFAEAKKAAPCIVFIDEIDAVGRKRGAGIGGGHDEREQTLNQLLVEMDGFATNSGIIILAATNRPDILDKALLRPGRFDRQILIGMPDIKAREEIFKIHSRNKPLAEGVNPKVLARRTPGFSPADIENMLNEAALLTARRNGKFIRMDEIEEAITKVMYGPEKKSNARREKENWLTAVHEAGHAIIARSLEGMDPVHKITIIPRGNAGGYTMTLPKDDKMYETKKSMYNFIIMLLGGRTAESLVLDDISTGASNDIMRATELAKSMVTKYGFSDKIGPVNYSHSEEVFLGQDFTSKQTYSEAMAATIDEEIEKLVHGCYDKAISILTEKKEVLLNVANALMKIETLDADQFEKLYTGELTPDQLEDQVDKEEEERKAQEEVEAKQLEEELQQASLLEKEMNRIEEQRDESPN